MHEMSIAMSILELAQEEAARQNCARLTRVRVRYGPLAGVMPDALRFCFEALCADRGQDIEFELEFVPLKLRCGKCGASFGQGSQTTVWLPCPQCGEEYGHIVEQGDELLLSQIEASQSQAKPGAADME